MSWIRLGTWIEEDILNYKTDVKTNVSNAAHKIPDIILLLLNAFSRFRQCLFSISIEVARATEWFLLLFEKYLMCASCIHLECIRVEVRLMVAEL